MAKNNGNYVRPIPLVLCVIGLGLWHMFCTGEIVACVIGTVALVVLFFTLCD